MVLDFRKQFMRALTSLLALSLIALPTGALAHTGIGAHDLAHGFMHPVGGIDHVLAMVAVGVFAFV
jgi:urease accessory protein